MSLQSPIIDAQLILHRGASAYAPENTLEALHLAADMGAKWVETDVRIIAGDALIMMHDDEVNRTTDGTGMAAHFTLEEMKALDAGGWFSAEYKDCRVPTLKEYLDVAQVRHLGVVLELKAVAGWEENYAHLVCREIEDSWKVDPQRLVISSFSERCLKIAAKELPHYPRCLALTGLPDDADERLREMDCDMIHMQHSFARNNELTRLNTDNIEFAVATVNDTERAKYFLENGASSVLTDKPDLFGPNGAGTAP
ncbi:MAG: glycerophosphodiester phosphodiesterase family protein [Stappiaceae bacterium]